MDSEDGELFIKQLATFVRTHEKALANALQLRRQNPPRHGASQSVSSVPTAGLTTPTTVPERPSTATASSSNGLAAALSFGSLNFTSQTAKSAKLALTPHHLFYLLSRFEELKIPVGPMKVRLENLHDTSTSANYVSFLSQSQRSKTRNSDVGSIRSVSSIRSVMSGMSALWTNFGIGSSMSAARSERQKAALDADLKYLYSAFTKVPCLRLAPDFRARLIKGYEEFPFDSAVPLHIFKNCQALEVSDIDFRQFFGWDRMADQLRSLTVKRASLADPADILIDIVLDDMDKRRRRTSKTHSSPTTTWPGAASPRRTNTLYSLDLSSNEFNEIPDSLASLTALRALNLSKCTIESLHSLTRNPLPAITALNLRDNRLQSLAGVERLYPLERLDLRDNRLKDPVELARLTRIPDIREIWVEGNPFTRTHKDYRVTIFNLFRQSPGYTEDVLIDMTGPTYSERKHLVERTQEPAPVPVIKPPVPELKAVDVSKPAIVYDNPKEPAVLRKERPAPKVTATVVEEGRTQASRGVPRIDTSVIPKLPPVTPTQEIGTPTSWTDSQKWDVGGEMYRRKIEALRTQVGDGYLNVLSEEHWDVNAVGPLDERHAMSH
ncbi:putative leucine rich repeat domain-containing protein [Diaporthe ampelina]|uniref:Putative leucine rich repeat domain-containing protein n=1 Tax=Diaporthe ampelina TaxID=1214573 RepID=A0A0G2HFC6_9PEZI|nr:putative leucine rich repeat domain-containing protein [Diaporthe ampelina]